MIDFYNSEVDRYQKHLNAKGQPLRAQEFVEKDTSRISWGGNWQAKFAKGKKEAFEPERISLSLYRPFTKMWHYGGKTFNHSFYSMPRIFPDAVAKNLVICVSGVGARSGFSSLISDVATCLDTLEKGQCFPLYLYDPVVPAQAGTQPMLDLAEADPLDSRPTLSRGLAMRGNDGCVKGNDSDVRGDGGDVHGNDGYVRRDAITDEGLAHFQSAYPGETISKEDVFYYVYGLLHSKDYRERYADNLSKELPRIPRVKTAAGFRAFSQAGRNLAELHLNYETVPIYQGAKVLGADGKVFNLGDPKPLDSRFRGNDEQEDFWRVKKMKVPKTDGKKDLTRLIYNAYITVSGIPPEAYDYVVNGKPALDWVVERQCVKTDNDSGIVNDANDWAIETMGNPHYPLELFLRVITVSLETMKIVNNLPPLDIASD